jgi:hypothetical protein
MVFQSRKNVFTESGKGFSIYEWKTYKIVSAIPPPLSINTDFLSRLKHHLTEKKLC